MRPAIKRLLFCCALLCAVLVHSVALAQERLLPIVFEQYPPYEYMEDGQVKGINMDLIREAFRRMGVTPVFEPRPWKRGLLELKTGDILALSSGFRTPERETFAFFPSEPLAMEVNVVATLRGSGVKVASLSDLSGLSVGVVREYEYGPEFDALRGIQRVETNSSHQLLRMLLNGRMDAAVGNRAVFDHLAGKMGRRGELSYDCEIGRGALYLFFSRARGAEAKALSRSFGEAVRAMREDGTFAAIEAKY